MAVAATGRGVSGAPVWRERAGLYGAVALVYLGATLATAPLFMADTADYVASVLARERGDDYAFWEFGHLFWRPLAWLCYRAFAPATRLLLGPDPRLNVTLVMCALSWAAGLCCVAALAALLRELGLRRRVVFVTSAAFACSHAFLNFAQTGCAYVPGMAFLLAGSWLMVRAGRAASAGGGPAGGALGGAVWGGLALAAAVCLWVPYVLVVPASLLAPAVLYGAGRRNLRLTFGAALACALAGALAYGWVVFGVLGLRDAAGIKEWFLSATHGMTVKGGAARAAYALARSLVNMGDDGRVLKRFLLRDPFNPVSPAQLFGLGLWKAALFYATALAVSAGALLAPAGRRVLALLALAAGPFLLFILVLYSAGETERYLPLYPWLFAALGLALGRVWRRPAVRYALLAGLAIMALVNLDALSRPRRARERAAVLARVEDLRPLLKPGDLVVVTHLQDELSSFTHNYLFEREPTPPVVEALEPATEQVFGWRGLFARRVLAAWGGGGGVWVSTRVLARRPRPEWNWVEGDDPNVSWTELPDFFAPLGAGTTVGGADGFYLLPRTPANEHALARLAGSREGGEAVANGGE